MGRSRPASRTFASLVRLGALAALLVATGCGSTASAPDAGAPNPDADERYDTGPTPDSGVPDLGPTPDTGRRDGGFEDPDTIASGIRLVNGVRTQTVMQGTRTSTMPPLVVVHRGPGTGSEYLPALMKPLVRGRTVVFYDVRGTGLSSYGDGTQSSTISVRQHVEDLAALIEVVNTDLGRTTGSPADVLGHHYGAAVAMRLAAAHPDRVDRLVLVNPYPVDIEQYAEGRAEIERRLTQPERMRFYSIVNRPECFGSEDTCFLDVWAIVGHHYLCPVNDALFTSMRFRTGSFRTEYLAIDRDLRESQYDWRPYLGRIRAPTLIISGPCDPTPAQSALDHAAGIPGARHVILGTSGQFPMLEQPELFHATVRGALRR